MKTKAIVCLTLIALSVSSISCSSENSVSVASKTDEFNQRDIINPKMDILWVVDNSGSMKQEIDNVINNINAFVGVYKDKKYDFHMGVVSSSAWSLESYKEYQDYKDCVTGGGSSCIPPKDGEDRSYLIHPDDNIDVFGRLHQGECLANGNPLSTGYPYIKDDTPDLEDVFAQNFNVFGDHSTGNCGTNVNLSPSNGTSRADYTPFIHDYYYGSKDLSGSSPHFGSSERSRLFAYVGDERPLQSMRSFLELSPDAQDFLRPDAFLAVILITDERDHSRPDLKANNGPGGEGDVKTDYIDRMNALKGSSDLFKAYVITQKSGRSRLHEAAELSGGLTVDINGSEEEYLENLLTITGNIVQASTKFTLKCKPDLKTLSVEFSVEDENGENTTTFSVPQKVNDSDEGWRYVAQNQSLVFSEQYYPESGTSVNINYTPANLSCSKD